MKFQPLIAALKGGAGSGNFGHSGRPGKIGGSATKVDSLSADELIDAGYIPVFRGTGREGIANIRPSSEGVLGPGIYFYDDVQQAKTYAEMGGGIVTGFVNPADVKVLDIPGAMFRKAHKVVVLSDPDKLIRRGNIPTEDTLDSYALDDIAKRKLNEL